MTTHPFQLESLESRHLMTCVAGDLLGETPMPHAADRMEHAPHLPAEVTQLEMTSLHVVPDLIAEELVAPTEDPQSFADGAPAAFTEEAMLTLFGDDDGANDEELAELLRANHRRWGNYQGICGSALMEMARDYPELYQQFLETEQALDDWLQSRETDESSGDHDDAETSTASCRGPAADECDALFAALQRSMRSQPVDDHPFSMRTWRGNGQGAQLYYVNRDASSEPWLRIGGVVVPRFVSLPAMPEPQTPVQNDAHPNRWGFSVEETKRPRRFHVHDRSLPQGHEPGVVDRIRNPEIRYRLPLE